MKPPRLLTVGASSVVIFACVAVAAPPNNIGTLGVRTPFKRPTRLSSRLFSLLPFNTARNAESPPFAK